MLRSLVGSEMCIRDSNIFVFEATAAWMWMLCSFQQFSNTKKLKYSGYSSWAGMMAVAYYSTQYMMSGESSSSASGEDEKMDKSNLISMHEKMAKEIEGIANASAHRR
eukprot:TRINITY_DN46408_c0_g1_i2.p1 TRINITY_DN46408_c0_g1~~TRINITY_DN46408_c0_g1_i2.p1  ORF type:complete len:108 (-),score=31.58 TRINITY_DN46408_c0_g1_i2:117-440(-)